MQLSPEHGEVDAPAQRKRTKVRLVSEKTLRGHKKRGEAAKGRSRASRCDDQTRNHPINIIVAGTAAIDDDSIISTFISSATAATVIFIGVVVPISLGVGRLSL